MKGRTSVVCGRGTAAPRRLADTACWKNMAYRLIVVGVVTPAEGGTLVVRVVTGVSASISARVAR